MLVNIYLQLQKKLRIIIILLLILNSFILSAQTYTLRQCVDSALQNNRNIQVAQQDVFIASIKNQEAKGNLLPKINGIVDYRYYTDLPYQLMPASTFGGPVGTYKEVQFGVPQILNANLQLTIPIYNPTAINAIKNSKLATELSEIQKMKTNEEIVMEVSIAYFNAQILLNQLTFLDSNFINMSKLELTTTILFEQQLAKATDVDRIKLQIEQLKTQRNSVFNQLQQVMNLLKFLMGKPISDTIEIQFKEEIRIENNYLHQTSSDLLLINKKIEFSHSELNGLKNSRLPSFGGYGIYGTNGFGTTGDNSFFNFHPVGYIGAQLTIPLFNGMISHQKIKVKKVEIDKINLQKEIILEKNKLEFINAEMQLKLALSTIETVKQQIELAKKIYKNTVLQNEQGLANITELLLADNALRDAQQSYIVALVNFYKANLEYKRVTGNLLGIK